VVATRAKGRRAGGWDLAARGEFRETPGDLDAIAARVIRAAVEVHRHLGPGLTEWVYENALAIELEIQGIRFERQWSFGVAYKGRQVGEGRMDLLVERVLVVELKTVERLAEVHVAQAIGYLRAMGLTLALLINFNVPVLLRGVKRVALNRTLIPDPDAASPCDQSRPAS
jgi:GxxExxY protein